MEYKWISPERALVFRITHIDNMSWIIENGLHCRDGRQDPSFVTIGNPDIISRRDVQLVPVEPWGTLSDYIPFHFTPFSPMAFNIKTGHGVPAVAPRDIVVLVASLRRLSGSAGVQFVYTDRHAVLKTAAFHKSLDELHCIDWRRLRARDFKRDNDELDKVERYQAEALVYRHLPTDMLEGIFCHGNKEMAVVQALADAAGTDLKVRSDSRVYF